jgi:hypothetical protein
MARVLSVDGVAYGRSAAALYRLLPAPREPEILVVRNGRGRLRYGLHSTRSLPRTDRATVRKIPATMPGRSIIDAAASMPFPAVCDLVDTAVARRLVRPAGLARRAAELRNSKRPGCTKVLHALATQHPLLDQARSNWEAHVLRLAGEHGIPEPVPNLAVVSGGQRRFLDIAWREEMVDLEFDGFEAHLIRRVFDDDRARQNQLVDDGWQVFRLTSKLLEADPVAAFAPIVNAVRARGQEFRRKAPTNLPTGSSS